MFRAANLRLGCTPFRLNVAWVSVFPSSIYSVSLLATYSKQRQNIVSEGNKTYLSHPFYMTVIGQRLHSAIHVRSARTFGDLDISCDLTHACVPRMHAFPPERRLPAIPWTSSVLMT